MGRLITPTDTALDTFDVIVIGDSDAAPFAARAAAEAGAKVLLTSPTKWHGWMSSGYGLNQQDVKAIRGPNIVGGLTRRFLERMVKRSSGIKSFSKWWRDGGQMRPQYSMRAMADLIDHPNITLLKQATLLSIQKSGTTITSVLMSVKGVQTRLYAKVFVEGSATGVLNQKALTSFSIGREANATHGESSNGVMASTIWDGPTNVDPYVTPGVSGSGLLFGVDAGALGTVGAADGRVMGFGFRPYLTSVVAEQIAWATYFASPPADYQASRQELLGRAMAANPTYYGHATLGLERVLTFYNLTGVGTAMGSPKVTYADINSIGPMSINYPITSELVEYVSATPERQAEIEVNAKNYALGLLYWLLFEVDARIPATIRTALGAYGFSKYELGEYGGWSPQFYVREGARAVGDLVLNQTTAVIGTNNGMTDIIAWGFYDFDSHPVRRLVVGGVVHTEGAQLTSLGTNYGFRVPMRVLFPKPAECTNLVCASQPSVSHVVWRCLRVAPSMMMVGAGGGAVAALAAKYGIKVQDVLYRDVAAIIDVWDTNDCMVLSAGGATPFNQGTWTPTGASWVSATSRFGGMDGDPAAYFTVAAANVAGHKRRANIYVYDDGLYDVFMWHAPDISTGNGGQGRATNLKVDIVTADGTTTRRVNQQYPSSNGGHKEYLGRFFLRAGTPSADYVEADLNDANGQVTWAAIGWAPVLTRDDA